MKKRILSMIPPTNPMDLVTRMSQISKIGFKCCLCDDIQECDYFRLFPNPPICDNCITILKGIISEIKNKNHE